MSLINQVLKDLEKRHAGAGEVRGEARVVRPLPEDVPRRSLWIAVGLVAAGAMAGSAWWFFGDPDTALHRVAPAKIAATPLAATPDRVLAPAALPQIPAKPATLIVQDPGSQMSAPAGMISANAAVLSPTAIQEIVALPQAAPNPLPPLSPAAALAARPVPSPPQPSALPATVPESPAAQSSAPPPEAADRPMRKTKSTASGSDRPAKVRLSGAHPGSYSEAGGVEAVPNIEKQVRPPSEGERAESQFREGMAALQAGDVAEAEDRLRAALAIDPLADKACQALLGLYMERGRQGDAEQLLEDRLRLDRKHFGFAMALARLQLEHDANEEALATLQSSLSYGEASSDYQAMLANTLARLGRHKEAAERFEAATRLAPRNPLWLMGLGIELRSYGRLEEARAAFHRAKELGGLTPQLVAFVDQQLRNLKER